MEFTKGEEKINKETEKKIYTKNMRASLRCSMNV